MKESLMGPMVEGYSVGAWCPTPDGSGKPEAVAISFKVKVGDIVLRLKSPRAVDEMIQLLQEYRNEVWPGSEANDGQHRRKS